jgi:hypothetical protein
MGDQRVGQVKGLVAQFLTERGWAVGGKMALGEKEVKHSVNRTKAFGKLSGGRFELKNGLGAQTQAGTREAFVNLGLREEEMVGDLRDLQAEEKLECKDKLGNKWKVSIAT